jgi:hypothetical protein
MAQGTRSPDVFLRFMDSDGRPMDGGTLVSFTAGTTSASRLYSDQAATVALANPLPLMHGHPGTTPTAVRLVTGKSYKLCLFNPSGATVVTQDFIEAVPLNLVNGNTILATKTTDFTTTSPTWVDFTPMIATITTRGGAILARASFPGWVTAGGQADLQFNLDGADYGIACAVLNTDVQMIPMMWNFNVPVPAAGTHTVKLRVMLAVAGTFSSLMQTNAVGSLDLLEVNM